MPRRWHRPTRWRCLGDMPGRDQLGVEHYPDLKVQGFHIDQGCMSRAWIPARGAMTRLEGGGLCRGLLEPRYAAGRLATNPSKKSCLAGLCSQKV